LQINSLITDIYETVKKDWFSADRQRDFHFKLSRSLNQETRVPGLRLSAMGAKCPRALWHSVHTPELEEPLPAWARIKYTYGHILEALVIEMAKAAGHEVSGEQDELVVDGIVGHRDCVIDGYVVDVKSSSTRGFQKFRDGSIKNDDPFGYLDQLDGYLVGSKDHPNVRDWRVGYLLAVDKQLGHLALYRHEVRHDHILQRIHDYRAVVEQNAPPACTCVSIPDGKAGNLRLDTKASYSPWKYCCNPNLKGFLYSDGPRYYTRVVRRPEVPELNKDGKII
jgi:hypothetical protein